MSTPAPLDARRLLRESFPVAVILAFWTLLSLLAMVPWLGWGLRVAGLVVAGQYVWIEGVQLADAVSPASRPADVSERAVVALRENVHVLLAAGAWFLVALVPGVVVRVLEFAGVIRRPAIFGLEPVTFVLTATGVATVSLYAIAVGRSRLATGAGARGPSPSATDD